MGYLPQETLSIGLMLLCILVLTTTPQVCGKNHSGEELKMLIFLHNKRDIKWVEMPGRESLPGYDITDWIKQLNLQQCAIVEIGEGFCAIFVELRGGPGFGSYEMLSVSEFFLGLCECAIIREWRLCSSTLAHIRHEDCTFQEATSTANTSVRVHRRLCDVTDMARRVETCNCSRSMANQPLYSVTGFPTCFRSPLPQSICSPRSVCGVALCSAKTTFNIHSVRCDPNCRGGQPFCEDVGPATTVPRTITSYWSEWSTPICNATCGRGVMYSEATCLSKTSCPEHVPSCECHVNHHKDGLKVTRMFSPCSSLQPCTDDYDIFTEKPRHENLRSRGVTGLHSIRKEHKKQKLNSVQHKKFFANNKLNTRAVKYKILKQNRMPQSFYLTEENRKKLHEQLQEKRRIFKNLTGLKDKHRTQYFPAYGLNLQLHPSSPTAKNLPDNCRYKNSLLIDYNNKNNDRYFQGNMKRNEVQQQRPCSRRLLEYDEYSDKNDNDDSNGDEEENVPNEGYEDFKSGYGSDYSYDGLQKNENKFRNQHEDNIRDVHKALQGEENKGTGEEEYEYYEEGDIPPEAFKNTVPQSCVSNYKVKILVLIFAFLCHY